MRRRPLVIALVMVVLLFCGRWAWNIASTSAPIDDRCAQHGGVPPMSGVRWTEIDDGDGLVAMTGVVTFRGRPALNGATLLGVAIDGDVRSLAVPSPELADRAVVGAAVTVTLVRPTRRNGIGAVLACSAR